MKTSVISRITFTALILLIILAFLIAPANLYRFALAQVRTSQELATQSRLRDERHRELKSRLTTDDSSLFQLSLTELAGMDEPGTLELWQAALNATDPVLKQQAWDEYQKIRLNLERKEFIPRLARINASEDAILQIAKLNGLETNIWSSLNNETVAAAPIYLLAELSKTGMGYTVLYDSVAEFQQALKAGDAQAQAIETARKAYRPETPTQVRIAVIDLNKKAAPASGYSDWLGDRENFLMSNGRFIAYLDIFTSDGSPEALNRHLEERYTKRGYQLAGFYTEQEFTAKVQRYFPGKSFNFNHRLRVNHSSDNLDTTTIAPDGFEGRYHSFEEAFNECRALAQSNPTLAQMVTLGQTYENRPIFALKISKEAAIDDSTKPDVLITGCYHAREWISVESPVYFANQLLSKYATDDAIRYMVDHLQIWIVPVVNPDGLVFSQSSGQNDGTNFWRKNRRPIAASGDCAAAVGVDLNRNYNFQWRLPTDQPCPQTRDDLGASDDPANEVFRGTEPESELEIKAIKSLLDNPARHFQAQIDYHSYSQLVLYPWSYQQAAAPDSAMLATLAKKMSDEIKKVDGKTYTPEQAQKLYVTTGSSSDYAYSMRQVAVPITVEMRPTCCDFAVPETQIDVTNEENWAGAKYLLNWATAPPILQNVQAFQLEGDGRFTKRVYSASWIEASASRSLNVDTRFPGIEAGRLQIRLQFSKPMDATKTPTVFLGRNAAIDELSVAQIDATEGWQKTVYQNDTWIGEVVIPQDADTTNPWRLSVLADDTVPFALDAQPQTIAAYGVGTNQWQNYEEHDGSGASGGEDNKHTLAPTMEGNSFTLVVASPIGGERVAAGDTYTVAWTLPKGSSFIPASHDIHYSSDGGFTFRSIQQIFGNVEKTQITLPQAATTKARIRVYSREVMFGNIIYGDSQADFTIGANVGTGMEIKFVSSERIDQTWTDSPFDEPNFVASGAMRLALTLDITNRGTVAVANPFLRVADMTRPNVLLSRDRTSKQIVGALQTFDVGSDNLLTPDETVRVRLLIGAINKKAFTFSVNLYGVASGGTISPAAPVVVWDKKVKSKGL
jgi:carboxypeptidase T